MSKVKANANDVVSQVVKEHTANLKNVVVCTVGSYIRSKRQMFKQLQHAKSSGALYRKMVSGEYSTKLKDVLGALSDAGITIQEHDDAHSYRRWYAYLGHMETVGNVSLRFSYNVYGPLVMVYKGMERWRAPLVFSAKYSSKRMIVHNTSLDVHMESEED